MLSFAWIDLLIFNGTLASGIYDGDDDDENKAIKIVQFSGTLEYCGLKATNRLGVGVQMFIIEQETNFAAIQFV